MSKYGPSSKKARLRKSPHTCRIHQFLRYTSVYKDSTAFWPAASGTQCKARIRAHLYWGEGGKENVLLTVRARESNTPPPQSKTKHQGPSPNFPLPDKHCFCRESHTWLLKRSHETQAVTKLTPMKVISEIFQKGYKENDLIKKWNRRISIYWFIVLNSRKLLKDNITTRKILKV